MDLEAQVADLVIAGNQLAYLVNRAALGKPVNSVQAYLAVINWVNALQRTEQEEALAWLNKHAHDIEVVDGR